MVIAFIFIILVIALMLAFYMNKREAMRRQEQHEHRTERFNRLLENLKNMQGSTNTKSGDIVDDERKQNSDL